MDFNGPDQRVATASKDLTKSGDSEAETIFAVHFTSVLFSSTDTS